MTELWLGVIAVSMLAIAIVHVVAGVAAARAATRAVTILEELRRDLGPTVERFQALSADAAKATSIVAERVERADATLTRLAGRVEQVEHALTTRWLEPARRGLARLTRKGRPNARQKPGPPVGDEPGSV
jgi:pantoate kinase